MSKTPLMQQFDELKAQAGDALLFFRMGDFYELFGEDAVVASQILGITLTSRDRKSPNPTPMAGVPHHSATSYIQKLLEAGKKVAIGEQVEDPATAKGIVKRELIRTFTPAVQFDSERRDSSYLATATPSDAAGSLYSVALLEPSTGETLLGEKLTSEGVLEWFEDLPVRHILNPDEAIQKRFGQKNFDKDGDSGVLLETLPSNDLSLSQAQEILRLHYGLSQLETLVGGAPSVLALGRLVHYACRSQKLDKLSHLRLPQPLQAPQHMVLGPRTPAHLDLLPSQDGTPSLYQLIDRTASALGARELRRWILKPLKDPHAITQRQDAVREMAQIGSVEKLKKPLSEVYDLERIMGRVNTRLANPRDTLALGKSLAHLPTLLESLQKSKSPALQTLLQSATRLQTQLAPLTRRILESQKEEAPFVSREGGVFQKGVSPELDRLLDLSENGQKWIIDLEKREREATSISSLKVRYNRVFGYYIEITKTHLKNVPAHYQRKQSMVNAERFFTDELKTFEEDILTSSSKQKALEQKLFDELLSAIQKETLAIMEVASLIAEVDVLRCLGEWVDEPGWCFPQIQEGLQFEVEAGRHPVVDAASHGSFVPNTVRFNEHQKTLLITGPNMGGKSTVMRQTALIILLGQMGCPVPAAQASWGVFHSLYTRIGAHDAIARGQSTFMVEMSELAHIVHHADERSFIILDEIGRGTSTFDGMSVAWATLEWICKKIKARTLFATHYHELTLLEGELQGLVNAHMAVDRDAKQKGNQKTLRFLYELHEGPSSESFGIQVASLAGLPHPLIQRAWKVLEKLEKAEPSAHGALQKAQLSLFDSPVASPSPLPSPFEEPEELPEVLPEEPTSLTPDTGPDPVPLSIAPHPVLEEIESKNIDEMTPIEALNFLAQIQPRLSAHRAASSSQTGASVG